MELKEAGLIKEVKPEFCKYVEPEFYLWRYDAGNDRFYMRLAQDGTILSHYLSVTAFCKMSLSTSPHLIDWMLKHGDQAVNIRDERAAYGTLLHKLAVNGILTQRVSFQEAREHALIEANTTGFPGMAMKWQMDVCADLCAFFLFYKEKVTDIIGLEFPVASDTFGLGGTIDIIGMVRFNRRVVPAVIDVKSGRKGFWEAHELQLQVYKKIWNEMFPNLPVSHVFNWAPAAWKTVPKYKFVNQTDSKYSTTVVSRMRIAKNEAWNKPPKERLWLDGEFNVRDFVPERHIKMLSLKEIEAEAAFFPETEGDES